MVVKTMCDIDRFTRNYVVVDECWVWSLALDPDGYGHFRVGSRTDGTRKRVRAHRWSYEHYVGRLPDNMTIDHLCRNRACVNPQHLEAVTPLTNTQRGERATRLYCKHGHKLYGKNLHIDPKSGKRSCKACRTRRASEYGRRTNWEAQRRFRERRKSA